MRSTWIVMLAALGCGRVAFDARSDADSDALKSVGDGPIDTVGMGPWGNIREVTELSIGPVSDDPTLTDDQLEIYFNSNRDGAGDIFRATRDSVTDPWRMPEKILELSTAANENTPEVSGDGLVMLFARSTPTFADVFISTRGRREDPWANPMPVAELNTTGADEVAPMMLASGLKLYLASNVSADYEIYSAVRSTVGAMWSMPALVNELAMSGFDSDPFVTAGDMVMYWASDRGGNLDLWSATRPAPGQPFGTLARLNELSEPTLDEDDVWLSRDEHTLYFTRGVVGGAQMSIYMATR